MKDVRELVCRAQQARTPESLGALITATQADVFHFLSRYLGQAADAEDATQETFRQALRAFPALRDPAAFPGWIHRIALRAAQDVLRGRAVRKRLAAEFSGRAESGEAAMGEAERTETRSAVRAAVGQLDEELRTTVVLRYEQELSYAEIAEAMDCPEGTVGKRLHTAHERLRRALAGVGVAIAVALLERELAAEPRAIVPDRLSRALLRLPHSAGEPGSTFARRRVAMATIASVLLVALAVLWFLRGRAATTGAPGMAASLGDGSPKGTSGDSPSTGAAVPAADRLAAQAVAPPAGPVPAGTGRVSGVLRDRESHEPLRGATVRLRSVDGPTLGKRDLQATTDAEGRWSFEADPGAWGLTAEADGYVCLQLDYYIADWRAQTEAPSGVDPDTLPSAFSTVRVEVVDGKSVVHDLDLMKGAAFRGNVVDAKGYAVEGALVEVTGLCVYTGNEMALGVKPSDRSPLPAVRTGPDGRFEISGVYPASPISLWVTRDGYVPVNWSSPPVGPPGDPVLVLRPALPVAGRIRSTSGQAVAGAVVFVANGRLLRPAAERSDGDGRFAAWAHFADLPVAAWAPGYGIALAAQPGSDPGKLDLVLPEALQRLHGIVRDPAGRPLDRAKVKICQLGVVIDGVSIQLGYKGGNLVLRPGQVGGAMPPDAESPATWTDEQGLFSIEGVALGEGKNARIQIETQEFTWKWIEVDSDAALDITLEFRK